MNYDGTEIVNPPMKEPEPVAFLMVVSQLASRGCKIIQAAQLDGLRFEFARREFSVEEQGVAIRSYVSMFNRGEPTNGPFVVRDATYFAWGGAELMLVSGRGYLLRWKPMATEHLLEKRVTILSKAQQQSGVDRLVETILAYACSLLGLMMFLELPRG